MLRIDAFTHFLPSRFLDALRERAPDAFRTVGSVSTLPALVDVEARLRVVAPFDDYRQVLTASQIPEPLMPPGARADLLRILNDEMAAVVRRHPDHFVGFAASLPLSDTEASLREIDRALGELGALGIQLFSNVGGLPLDEPRFAPVFARMAEADRPIWLHPARPVDFADYRTESASRYNIHHIFGWPYETTAALTRIVFAGYMKRFPNLEIIAHHAGGVLPHFEGRFLDMYGAEERPGGELGQKLAELETHPNVFFRRINGDTALNGSDHALRCALAYFGSGRLVFATDLPYGPEMGARRVRDNVKCIDALPIAPEEKEAIYWGNAARLLKLPAPVR